MRRRTTLTTLIAIGAMTGASAITAGAASAAPPPTQPDAEAEMTPVDTVAVEPSPTPKVFVDDSGTAVAQITVIGVDAEWVDFGENDEPASDSRYVQATIRVESLSPRGLFEVTDDDFALQDADGFVFKGDTVPTAAQDAADEELLEEWELVEGDVIEIPVTFEIVDGIAPATLYFLPDSDRLVTLTALS